MLEKIIKYVPPGLKDIVYRHFYVPLEHIHSYKFEKYYRDHSYKLKNLKDIHKGQRCFIIGTGPSLNKTNLSLLKNEIIFGVNTLYRGLSRFGITCDYYAVSDVEVWKTHFKNILDLDTVLFLSSYTGKDYLSNLSFYQKFQKGDPIVIRDIGDIRSSGWLNKDLSMGAYWGSTVIIDICLQAAYYMGFKEVYLLGCDCDYTGVHRFDGLPTENVVQDNWPTVFAAYKICKDVYESDGREIINASVGGDLEVFKREKLEKICRGI